MEQAKWPMMEGGNMPNIIPKKICSLLLQEPENLLILEEETSGEPAGDLAERAKLLLHFLECSRWVSEMGLQPTGQKAELIWGVGKLCLFSKTLIAINRLMLNCYVTAGLRDALGMDRHM